MTLLIKGARGDDSADENKGEVQHSIGGRRKERGDKATGCEKGDRRRLAGEREAVVLAPLQTRRCYVFVAAGTTL